MSMLKDPEMKDVIIDFCTESNRFYEELEDMLDDLEENPNDKPTLEKFGQTIDRIMGAAKSIDAVTTGKYCELGKIIGYKASQIEDEDLLNIIIAVLFDTVDILKELNESILAKGEETIKFVNLAAFGKRLHWLADKLKHIDRASVSIGTEKPKEAAPAAEAAPEQAAPDASATEDLSADAGSDDFDDLDDLDDLGDGDLDDLDGLEDEGGADFLSDAQADIDSLLDDLGL
jgi:chemotaxis protein histidine kinase CheA